MIKKDILWKSIIEDFFPELMAFFYPESIHLLDFSDIEFLDKEFQQLFPESADSRRYADKLVKIRRTDGQQLWQLIHIEVQGYRDPTFEERMFRYYYRIFDRYGLSIEALVVFVDPHANYHPKAYQVESFKTRLSYEFHTYKLLGQDARIFEESSNPFAMVMLTALEALKAKKLGDEHLLELKLKLFRKLLARGYEKNDISRLTTFIKYYMRFAKPKMNRKFDEVISEITQSEEPMGIIESILHETQKEAFAEGIEKGAKRTLSGNITKLLLKGFKAEQVVEMLEVPMPLVEEVVSQLRAKGKLT